MSRLLHPAGFPKGMVRLPEEIEEGNSDREQARTKKFEEPFKIGGYTWKYDPNYVRSEPVAGGEVEQVVFQGPAWV